MKIKIQLIIFALFAFFHGHSQNQLVSVGFGLGRSFQENSGFSYGGQLSLSSSLDSSKALTVGIGYSKSIKYKEISAFSFGLGLDFYSQEVFKGLHIGPSATLGLQSPGNFKLFTVGVGLGHVINAGSNVVIDPSIGLGYTFVLGYSQYNALAMSGVVAIGFVF